MRYDFEQDFLKKISLTIFHTKNMLFCNIFLDKISQFMLNLFVPFNVKSIIIFLKHNNMQLCFLLKVLFSFEMAIKGVM